jgi:hypothetical protein
MNDSPDVPRGLAPSSEFVPPVETDKDRARRQKALRRVERNRRTPPWLKLVPRIVFPIYGLMRAHDSNYEEHYEHWKEEQRSTYGGGSAE